MNVRTIRRSFLALLLIGCGVFFTHPAHAAADGDELDTVGHTADGVYLDFAPFGSVELPRIFLVERQSGGWGIDAFGSTKAALHSGAYVLEHEGEDGHVETVRDEEALTEMIAHHEHLYSDLRPASGSIVIDFSITRHLVFGLLAALITLFVFVKLARQYRDGQGRDSAPRGIYQNMFESAVVFVRDEIARPNIRHKHETFLPFLLTAFFFILFSNILGLVPFAGAATSNISITLVLAAFTFVLGQVHASKDHWRHIFWPPGVPFLIKFILIPVEFVGLFTKHAALAIRLFANMMAGSLVILSLIGLIFTINMLFGGAVASSIAPISVALTLFISCVKLLVAFIQAYVFTMLSALFIGMAVEEHHEHEGPTPADDEPYHDLTPTFSDDGDVAAATTVSREAVPVG
ncbi:MAG: F0F1 ATP synthase subunit A [Rhodothermales bacterium]